MRIGGRLPSDELRRLVDALHVAIDGRDDAPPVGPMPLDRVTVLTYARLYDRRAEGTADALVEHELTKWFGVDTSGRLLDKEHFLKLCNWKSPRPRKRYKQNDEEVIAMTTYRAIEQTTDERTKVKLLCTLSGVNIRVASVILHFAEPDKYMILDRRAMWSLRWPERSYSFALWWKYTRYARQLSAEIDLPLRTIDKALWDYSNRYEPR